MQSRSGPRAIVLFTDGTDHVGGLNLGELIARCQQASIATYAVGLKTNELDPTFLDRLGRETHGEFLMADRVDSLGERFNEIANRLRRPFYRLAVSSDAPESSPLTIQFGAKNRVTLTVGNNREIHN